MESGSSCKTTLKWLGVHVLLFNLISFQLDVLLAGNIMQIYNLGWCGYYPEEITDRANAWTLIEEIDSFYCEEKYCGLFLVVT